MLTSLFEWFDAHAQSYWVIAATPTLILLSWTAVALRDDPRQSRFGRHEGLFALLLLAVLLAWRWPFLLSADEYNPDESQLIAGALTLWVDPVPWRGVDGFTSGPLNFYPLMAIRAFGLPLDYFTARLMALLMIWGALLACYRLFRSWFETAVARISILPALAFFATVTDWDFIHYSSEHLSLFLTALSAACILSRGSDNRLSERGQIVGCFIAGLLPLAKLQSGPLATALLFIALYFVGDVSPEQARKSQVAAWSKRLAAAALPSVLLLLIAVSTGQFEHLSRSYVLQNLIYLDNRESLIAPMREMWAISLMTAHFPYFLAITLIGQITAALAVRQARGKSLPLFFGAGLVVASAVCILAPRRALLHYTLLCVVPLTVALGLSLGRWFDSIAPFRRIVFGLLALIGCGLLPFGVRLTQPLPDMVGSFAAHWREPRTALATMIRAYARTDTRLAIWGWLPSLYVETGLPQATRDGNTSWAIIPSPQRKYYANRFFTDIQRTQPDIFVDAVGPGDRFFSDRTRGAHEIFSPLAEYIQQHYRLVADESSTRVYVKHGVPDPHLSEKSQTQLLLSKGDRDPGNTWHPDKTTPPDLQLRQIRTGYVQIMQPPAEIVWTLDETTREVVFEYGFAPEAYRNARSDGAELIFELHSEGVPVRHLFYRFLDPVRRPSDRGPVTARLILPPFQAGARLVARTTAGPAGNAEWDWIYLRGVTPIRMATYSPAQFPHFNRMPDSVDANLSYLLQEKGENILILHAPARLTYQLTGKERMLRFKYGFRSGAYDNGGHTDGATFLVEIHKTSGTSQTLFESQLAPSTKIEDRAEHSANFFIPDGNNGDTLVIRIDPGKGNAWDWTYITSFQLE